MIFEFAKQPLSNISEYWRFGLKLYMKSITKVWYLVLISSVVSNMMPVLIKFINGSIAAQSHTVAVVVSIFVILLITSFIAGATLSRMYSIAKSESINLTSSLNLVWQKYTTIVISMLIGLVLSAFAWIFLIIPGIFVAMLLICYLPLILFDNAGVVSSLTGSVKLVWGNWWRTSLAVIPPMAVLFTFSLTFHYFSNQPMLVNILNILAFTIIYPLCYALMLVVFNDLKLRKQ